MVKAWRTGDVLPWSWTREFDSCLSDNESYELLDQECLRLEQAGIIDTQNEAKCGLVTLNDILRHHAREQARHVLQSQRGGADHRHREATDGVASMQIGAVKGNCVKDKGKCEQHWCLRDDNTMVTALWTCSYYQRDGHVKRLCRIRARDSRKKVNAKKHLCMNTGAVIEGVRPAVVTGTRLLQQRDGRGWLIHALQHHAKPKLNALGNVESDSIIRDLERVLTGTDVNRIIVHLGTKRVCCQLEQQTTAMTSCGTSC